MSRTRSIPTRLTRSLLALALLPAAGGIALATAGISAASGGTPTAHVQVVRSSTTHTEPGDDRGTDRPAAPSPTRPTHPTQPTPKPIVRAPEVGDDSGGHGGRTTAARAAEPGDDSSGHATQTRTRTRSHGTEAGDDSAGRSASVSSARSTTVRAPEPGDDSGGHGGSSGRHGGSSGRHGGSDDGPNHS